MTWTWPEQSSAALQVDVIGYPDSRKMLYKVKSPGGDVHKMLSEDVETLDYFHGE